MPLNTDKQRQCPICRVSFLPRSANQQICSDPCRDRFYRSRAADDVALPTGTVGAAAELLVAAELMQRGWHVFRSLSPTCFCDLVAFKDGQSRRIEVRTGTRQIGGTLSFPKTERPGVTEYAVWIRNTGEIIFVPVKQAGEDAVPEQA